MALTVARADRTNVYGNRRVTTSTVTFDASYPTGGESLTPAQVGLKKISRAHTVITTPGGSVVSAPYDITNSKLKALTATAEVADTTSLSTLVVQLVATGY